MKLSLCGYVVASIFIVASGAQAADGQAVYDQNCAACHKMLAPKTGDKAAWAPLISQGTDRAHCQCHQGQGHDAGPRRPCEFVRCRYQGRGRIHGKQIEVASGAAPSSRGASYCPAGACRYRFTAAMNLELRPVTPAEAPSWCLPGPPARDFCLTDRDVGARPEEEYFGSENWRFAFGGVSRYSPYASMVDRYG